MIDLRKIDCLRCGGQHEVGDCPTSSLPSGPAPSSAVDAAYERVVAAMQEFAALVPPPPNPTSPVRIAPTLLHASPNSFRLGYNISLDAGGYMPGKIPVMVIPARAEDLRSYARKRTVQGLLAALGLKQDRRRKNEQ